MRKFVVITILLASTISCKTRQYTVQEKENIRITDSIANAQIQDRIIDLREDYD